MEDIESIDEFNKYIFSLHPLEVEKYVYDIFQASNTFSDVQLNRVINNRQIDITLKEKNKNSFGASYFWAIEVKSQRSPVSTYVVDAFLGKQHDLQQIEPHTNLLIISTSGFTNSAIQKAQSCGITLWGLNELYEFFNNHPIDISSLKPHKKPSNPELSKKVEAFKKTLNNITPGKENWSKYQSLIVDILEFLFCPPLEAPEVELSDRDKRNRRDIIFENGANDGFWRVVRDVYQGHYIVVDAKNYTAPLNKKPIIEIAHYLKPYGCGMFALIISRNGLSAAGKHATKEQWIGNKKLIVSLSDNEILTMLELKNESSPVEDVIKKNISDFRMSL